jgi:hypothetical protein
MASSGKRASAIRNAGTDTAAAGGFTAALIDATRALE